MARRRRKVLKSRRRVRRGSTARGGFIPQGDIARNPYYLNLGLASGPDGDWNLRDLDKMAGATSVGDFTGALDEYYWNRNKQIAKQKLYSVIQRNPWTRKLYFDHEMERISAIKPYGSDLTYKQLAVSAANKFLEDQRMRFGHIMNAAAPGGGAGPLPGAGGNA